MCLTTGKTPEKSSEIFSGLKKGTSAPNSLLTEATSLQSVDTNILSKHLEDLIVTKSFRGLGIGFSLLKKFIEFANSTNVRRIQWVVLDWNLEAINFYKKFGASTFDNWKITQMDDKAINTFINNQ